jgi:hypothetical protein
VRSTVMKISAGRHGVNGRRRPQPTAPLDGEARTGHHQVAVGQNGTLGEVPVLVVRGGTA